MAKNVIHEFVNKFNKFGQLSTTWDMIDVELSFG